MPEPPSWKLVLVVYRLILLIILVSLWSLGLVSVSSMEVWGLE